MYNHSMRGRGGALPPPRRRHRRQKFVFWDAGRPLTYSHDCCLIRRGPHCPLVQLSKPWGTSRPSLSGTSVSCPEMPVGPWTPTLVKWCPNRSPPRPRSLGGLDRCVQRWKEGACGGVATVKCCPTALGCACMDASSGHGPVRSRRAKWNPKTPVLSFFLRSNVAIGCSYWEAHWLPPRRPCCTPQVVSRARARRRR